MNFKLGDRVIVTIDHVDCPAHYIGSRNEFNGVHLVHFISEGRGWPISSRNICMHKHLRNIAECSGFTERLWWVSALHLRSAP